MISYLCKDYGTELYLDRLFPDCFSDSSSEVGILRRFRRVPGNDGLHVLIVEDGI